VGGGHHDLGKGDPAYCRVHTNTGDDERELDIEPPREKKKGKNRSKNLSVQGGTALWDLGCQKSNLGFFGLCCRWLNLTTKGSGGRGRGGL